MLHRPTAPTRPAVPRGDTPTARRRPARLRPFCRAAIADAAAQQGLSVDGLIALIDGRRGRASLATAAERFVALYFHARTRTRVCQPGLREEMSLLDEVLDRLR